MLTSQLAWTVKRIWQRESALQPSAAGGGGEGRPTVGAMGYLQVTDQVIKQSVIISTDVFAHIKTLKIQE